MEPIISVSTQPSEQRSFQVYSASAGAGKTFSLVREYLVLCLETKESSRFASILAITFTTKAAAEMKKRVIRALDGFRRDVVPKDQEGLFHAVRDQLNISESELRIRANAVLRAMLHNYTGLSISTIDKFTYRLVRTFSHDLGLSTHFEVELDEKELYRQSVDLLLDDSGRNSELTSILQRYVERRMDEGKSWKPEHAILKMADHLGNESSYEILKKLADISLPQFIGIRKALEKKRAVLLSEVNDLIGEGEQLLSGIPDEYFSYKAVPGYLSRLRKGDLTQMILKSRETQQMEAGSFIAKSAGAEIRAVVEPVTPQIIAWLERGKAFQDSSLKDVLMLDLVLRDFDGTAVLQELSRKLDEYKEANNLETLNTFNQLIHESLKALPVPYIYERIGEKYRHYFIDEFQDTSVLQWENLTPLVHNSVSSGGSTMIVGDAKQSIYRWRGGEAEQFLSLIDSAKDPEAKGGDVSYALRHIALGENWRSGSVIVDFNNRLFEILSANLRHTPYRELYGKSAQNAKGHNGGYVELVFPEKSDTYREEVLDQTLDRVRTCINDGFEPGDIAVLTRSRFEGAEVVRKLTEAGLSVVSVDSLRLENSSAVRAVVALIRIRLYPEDVEARMEWVEMMYQTGVRISSDEELHYALWSASDIKGDRWETWLGEQDLSHAVRGSEAAGLYEWGESAARDLGLIGNREADPFLQFFLDEMYDYGKLNTHNPGDFLNWWYDKGKDKSISVPESSGAVQVMTIHKSKGLEFPVVIFPFAHFDTFERAAARWVELDETRFEGLPVAQLSMSRPTYELIGDRYPAYAKAYDRYQEEVQFDSLNLLYVTLTRPEERLYVISQYAASTEKLSQINQYLIRYLESEEHSVEPGSTHTFGEPGPPKEKSEATTVDVKPEARKLKTLTSLDWRDRVRLSRTTDGPGDRLSEQPRRWGTTIHDILGKIRTEKDIDPVLKKWNAEGALPDMEISGIRRLLEGVVNHSDLQSSFHADEIYLERDWVGAGVVLRPDRVSRKGDEWTVIDYKTGERKSAHAEQVRMYAGMLTAQGRKVRALLVYVGEDVEVDQVDLDPPSGDQLSLEF